MKHYSSIFIIAATIILAACSTSEVYSPDNCLLLQFSIDNSGIPHYMLTKNGDTLLLPSRLGFDNHTYTLKKTEHSKFNETWETTWGEEQFIKNQYRELAVSLLDEENNPVVIRFRIFNDGFAFRYEFGGNNEPFEIYKENTEYSFTDDPELWYIPWTTPYYEGLWQKSPMTALRDTACSPLTIEYADGSYAFLHEAALDDYPAQNFYVTDNGDRSIFPVVGTFLTPLSDGVSVHAERGRTKSPWRFMTVAGNITQLAASRIMLNLNEPCKIEDTSWIQPMKFIGIWWAIHLDHYTWCYRILDEKGNFLRLSPNHGATTDNMRRYLDFAAEHGFGGVLAEGWNEGWDGDWTSNLADFTTPTPDFDISYLSRYAHDRGVQIIGHHETGGNTQNYESQLLDAFHYYDTLGIHNVKTGYVHAKLDGKEWHKSQYGVRHMNHVIRTAAENHVCIDNHECVMPTGLCRTYPNLMSGEGVRGQEWDAWSTDGGSPAEHLCVLPFTRCMAGPVDFTPGTFDFSNPIHPQTRVHSTLARQLALFVTIYSPLQMASDMPESYMQHPDAFHFIEQVPCDWKQSVVLDATIGDYVVTTRQDRHSDNWYLGATTDENPRDISIPLSFLEKGKTYEADIYRDAPETDWVSNPYAIVIEKKQVTAADTLNVRLAAAGGCAMRLVVKD